MNLPFLRHWPFALIPPPLLLGCRRLLGALIYVVRGHHRRNLLNLLFPMDGDLGHSTAVTKTSAMEASAFPQLGTFPQLPETAPPAHPWLQPGRLQRECGLVW